MQRYAWISCALLAQALGDIKIALSLIKGNTAGSDVAWVSPFGLPEPTEPNFTFL